MHLEGTGKPGINVEAFIKIPKPEKNINVHSHI